MGVYIESQVVCLILTALLFALFHLERAETVRFTSVVGLLSVLMSIADICSAIFAKNTTLVSAFAWGYGVFFAVAAMGELICLWKQCIEQKKYAMFFFGVILVLIGAIQLLLFKNALSLGGYIIFALLLMLFSHARYKKIITDKLTGLCNRYAMDIEIKKQLRQYKIDKTDSFYIIACDLDNFKTINDTWGHAEGDRALVLIAEALTSIAAQYHASVFRIGGDEFVIITDITEQALIDGFAAKLKKQLEDIDFRDDFEIRMSVGTALYDGATPVTELIECADKNLYLAKKKK